MRRASSVGTRRSSRPMSVGTPGKKEGCVAKKVNKETEEKTPEVVQKSQPEPIPEFTPKKEIDQNPELRTEFKKTLENSEDPKIQENSESSDDTKIQENPIIPIIPENPENPKIPENPEPKIPENSEPKIPENPEPKIPENSEPKIPENPKNPENPKISDKEPLSSDIPTSKPKFTVTKKARRASTMLNFTFDNTIDNKDSEIKNSENNKNPEIKNSENNNSENNKNPEIKNSENNKTIERRTLVNQRAEKRLSASWAQVTNLLPTRNRAQSVGGRKNKEVEIAGPERTRKTETPEKITVKRKICHAAAVDDNNMETEEKTDSRKNSRLPVENSLDNFISTDPKTNEEKSRKIQNPKIHENSNSQKKTFKDLPDSIKKKCFQLKIDRTLLEENVEIIFRVASFLYKKNFQNCGNVDIPSNAFERRPSATPEILEYGKKELKIPEKKLKKLFKSDSLVGSGGYGKVYMAKDYLRKERVAIKKVRHDSEKLRNNNFSEIGFISCCKHPNIVEYFGSYLNHVPKKELEEVWMVFQYMHGGTLTDAARSFKFSDIHIAFISRELCKGVKHLHDKNWCHRDIKSTNIMMDTTGVIKLIDFGLCADMSEGPRIKMLGSSFWIPPEMIRREPHSLSADIWSLAVCILELFLTVPPHAVSSFKCMFYAATIGLADVIPDSAENDAKDWLKKCLVVDPKKRATVDELLAHPWLNQPNIETGISDIFRSIFLNHSLSSIV